MKLLDKITTLLSSQQQSSSCPANSPNEECSLLSELREVQNELKTIENDDHWEFNVNNTLHTVTFSFSYSNIDENFYRNNKDTLNKLYQQQIPNFYRLIYLQNREIELKERLGLK